MEQTELNEILEQHRLWIGGKRGKCASLRNADLRGANLTGADLTGANLTDAFLEGAFLEFANLWGANLSRANLRGANLTRASLEDADLRYANLTDADLTDADLTHADLTGANLTDADLTGANLLGADLGGAYLTGANLRDAILNCSIGLPDVSWIIPGCLVNLSNIRIFGFYLYKEGKYDNFVKDSLGFFIQDNPIEKTFDMLAGDRIIRNIPDWVKYSGLNKLDP